MLIVRHVFICNPRVATYMYMYMGQKRVGEGEGEEGKGVAGITVSQLKCSNFTVLVDHRCILKCPVSM